MSKFLLFSIQRISVLPKSGGKLDLCSSHYGMRILPSVEEHESGGSLHPTMKPKSEPHASDSFTRTATWQDIVVQMVILSLSLLAFIKLH